MEMRKIFALIITLFMVGSLAQAQDFPSQIWHQGKVFLTTGEIAEGKVKYDLEANVVQVHREGIETFSATTVDHFEIFDEYYGGIGHFTVCRMLSIRIIKYRSFLNCWCKAMKSPCCAGNISLLTPAACGEACIILCT